MNDGMDGISSSKIEPSDLAKAVEPKVALTGPSVSEIGIQASYGSHTSSDKNVASAVRGRMPIVSGNQGTLAKVRAIIASDTGIGNKIKEITKILFSRSHSTEAPQMSEPTILGEGITKSGKQQYLVHVQVGDVQHLIVSDTKDREMIKALINKRQGSIAKVTQFIKAHGRNLTSANLSQTLTILNQKLSSSMLPIGNLKDRITRDSSRLNRMALHSMYGLTILAERLRNITAEGCFKRDDELLTAASGSIQMAQRMRLGAAERIIGSSITEEWQQIKSSSDGFKSYTLAGIYPRDLKANGTTKETTVKRLNEYQNEVIDLLTANISDVDLQKITGEPVGVFQGDLNNYGLKCLVDSAGEPLVTSQAVPPFVLTDKGLREYKPPCTFKYGEGENEVVSIAGRYPVFYDPRTHQLYSSPDTALMCDVSKVTKANGGVQDLAFADGAGHGEASRKAATDATDIALAFMKSRTGNANNAREIAKIQCEALQDAHRTMSKSETGKKTTLMLASVVNMPNGKRKVVVTSIGDSAVFVVRNKVGTTRTCSTTAGHLRGLPDKNDAGGDIGASKADEYQGIDFRNLTVTEFDLDRGDDFVLCSDGFHDTLRGESFEKEFLDVIGDARGKDIQRRMETHVLQAAQRNKISMLDGTRTKFAKKGEVEQAATEKSDHAALLLVSA